MTGRRRDLLDLLRAATEPLEIGELAASLGVHANTVRFHLDALTDAGLVQRVERSHAGVGRPPLAFRAHTGMDPGGPRSYQLLSAILVDGLASSPDAAAQAADLGRRWGAALAAEPEAVPAPEQATARLTELLASLGFEPETPAAPEHLPGIALRHCPFLELVETRADVVCSLHLGLMQGAMERLEGPVRVESLDAFVEPDLCLAHLSGAAAH